MIVRNYLTGSGRNEVCHDGQGLIYDVELFREEDFRTPLRFLHYVEIPPGASIGMHGHLNDEEIYIIVSGEGVMTVNGEVRKVSEGDVILNEPYGRHSLENQSSAPLRALLFEVGATLR